MSDSVTAKMLTYLIPLVSAAESMLSGVAVARPTTPRVVYNGMRHKEWSRGHVFDL